MTVGLWMCVGVAGGCGALPKPEAQQVGAGELRGAAPIESGRAEALLSGPALVRHVEADGRGVVTLYLSDDPGIGDRACPPAAAEAATPIAVLQGQSRLTDLLVPKGQRVCAAVSNGRAMRVAWHAQPVVQDGAVYQVALLAR